MIAGRQPFTLATLAERPFSDSAWLFEIYVGVRVLALRRGDRVELYGRSGRNTTARANPEVVRALRGLPIDSFRDRRRDRGPRRRAGRPSFQRLQPRMASPIRARSSGRPPSAPNRVVSFDCLMLDNLICGSCPSWSARVTAAAGAALGAVRYGDHVAEAGEAFFELASEQRLEGIVAKKARSLYSGARTRDWIKIKCQRRQEFVIGGYTDPQGSRGHFGALHLGVYDGPADAPRLVYVSRQHRPHAQRRVRHPGQLPPSAPPPQDPAFDSVHELLPDRPRATLPNPAACRRSRFTDWTETEAPAPPFIGRERTGSLSVSAEEPTGRPPHPAPPQGVEGKRRISPPPGERSG